jgi:hypothetical protein
MQSIKTNFDLNIFNGRPLASLVRLTQNDIRPTPEKKAARFTGQAWPDIIAVALRANLKPFVLSQLCSFNLIGEAMVT